MVAICEPDGFVVFAQDTGVADWAKAAHREAIRIAADPEMRAKWLRHGQTWFVGVDALPNAADGSIGGAPLSGPWKAHLAAPPVWHPAQLSVVYPGYPRRDPDESASAHAFRIDRAAAHIDGLLPVGPARRRYLREPHAFILGLPLNRADAAPLIVWPGSHRIVETAFRTAFAGRNPAQADLTETYHATRKRVFEECEPLALVAEPGQAILLHRMLVHGVDIWRPGRSAPPEGRMIAYFRPELPGGVADWLAL